VKITHLADDQLRDQQRSATGNARSINLSTPAHQPQQDDAGSMINSAVFGEDPPSPYHASHSSSAFTRTRNDMFASDGVRYTLHQSRSSSTRLFSPTTWSVKGSSSWQSPLGVVRADGFEDNTVDRVNYPIARLSQN
ncbi:MAG TPA: hypothetical protein VFC19_00250, partial [Candidatus Limnocylindrales bacterium]|nr:hypothetical protein [Candidatus Limnocylindrales bacterium]